MTLKRETIVLASAIVGANLIGILTYSQTAKSSVCDDLTNMWNGSTQSYNRQPVDGYYDVRTKKDVPIYADQIEPTVSPPIAPPVETPQATTPMPPSVAPVEQRQSYAPVPLQVDELDRGNLERARARVRGTLRPDSQGNVAL